MENEKTTITAADTATPVGNGDGAGSVGSKPTGENHENRDSNINSEGHATRVGEMNDDSHAVDKHHVEVDTAAAVAGKCPFV
jgi:hypothetical protein